MFNAPIQAPYEFGIAHQDDRTSIWLDLDQDGIFEVAGDAGNEQLRDDGQANYVTINLDPGTYNFAVAYRQGGGGAGTDIRITIPTTGTPFYRGRIRPGLPLQHALWGVRKTEPLDTSVPGTHLITYTSQDANGLVATATRTVVVVEDDTLPFISLNGDLEVQHEAGTPYNDEGAKVLDASNNVIETSIDGVSTVDVDVVGEYTVTFDYTDGNDKAAQQVIRKVFVVDTSAPVVTLKPHPDTGGLETINLIVGDEWIDPGIEIQDADSNAWFVSSREYVPNQLEQFGYITSVNDSMLSFTNDGGFLSMEPAGSAIFKSGPNDRGFYYLSDAEFRSLPNGITRNDHYGTVTTGYFQAKVDGVYEFRTDTSDNRITFWLDENQDEVFQSGERVCWHNQTGTRNLQPGFYRIAIGHYETTGNSRGRFQVKTPDGAGPTTLVPAKPTAVDQSGLWFAKGEGAIDTTFPGTHTITYYALDSGARMTTITRTVIVESDPNAPVLTLLGEPEVAHQQGEAYQDAGVTAADKDGGDLPLDGLTKAVTLDGNTVSDVDGTVAGTYVIQYDFTDAQDAKATPLVRTVVVADTTLPVITLLGDNPHYISPGFAYLEPGATATDSLDGDLPVNLPAANFSTAGEATFELEYTATDAAGNIATAIREVIIKDDPNRPVINLLEGENYTQEAGTPYVEPGVAVTNGRGSTFDASLVVATGNVDHTQLGTYTLTYNFEEDGKAASPILREVTVVDTTPPNITLTNGNKIRVSTGATFEEPGYSVTDNLDTNLTVQVQLETTGLKPVAHWEFDETEGTVARELMNGINGTLQSFPDPAAAWVTGKYGNALKFVGTNGSYVSIPGTDLLDLQSFTISLWIRTDDFLRNGMVFEKTTDNTVNSQFNLHFDDSDTFYFRVNDGFGDFQEKSFTTSDVLQASKWEHIAVTYDGAVQKIFVNQELIAQVQQDVTIPVTPAAGPAYIGATAPGDSYHFTGLLDDLKIYNSAVDEQVVEMIQKRSGVDTSKVKLDPFRLSYTSTDSNGNAATVIREVVVSNDANPPNIILTGDNPLELVIGDPYEEHGAVAIDEEDGVVTPRLVIQGTVDTTKAGTYTITYDVMDLSFNKAEQVVRTVIVGEPKESNPLEEWKNTHLSSLPADDQKMDADPDQDGLQNLIEYALNANPNLPDSHTQSPTVDASSGSLKITFLRYKVPADFGISYHVELSTDLLSNSWSEAEVTVVPDTNQDGVPTNFEKVTATANTPIANEPTGQQFIRIRVQEE